MTMTLDQELALHSTDPEVIKRAFPAPRPPTASDTDPRRERLVRAHTTMLDYLQMRVDAKDWHGVRDAAADLEVIEARIAMLT